MHAICKITWSYRITFLRISFFLVHRVKTAKGSDQINWKSSIFKLVCFFSYYFDFRSEANILYDYECFVDVNSTRHFLDSRMVFTCEMNTFFFIVCITSNELFFFSHFISSLDPKLILYSILKVLMFIARFLKQAFTFFQLISPLICLHL